MFAAYVSCRNRQLDLGYSAEQLQQPALRGIVKYTSSNSVQEANRGGQGKSGTCESLTCCSPSSNHKAKASPHWYDDLAPYDSRRELCSLLVVANVFVEVAFIDTSGQLRLLIRKRDYTIYR